MMNFALFSFNSILCLWTVDAAFVKLPVPADLAGREFSIFVDQYFYREQNKYDGDQCYGE